MEGPTSIIISGLADYPETQSFPEHLKMSVYSTTSRLHRVYKTIRKPMAKERNPWMLPETDGKQCGHNPRLFDLSSR
jgi:hypothetical protein